MSSLEFNQRAAIAAAVQELTKDSDIPVYVEGDVWNGKDYEDMDAGEAARVVVDVVLDHPFVKAVLEEREAYWDALKWLVSSIESLPEDRPEAIVGTLFAAMAAAAFESMEDGPILDD